VLDDGQAYAVGQSGAVLASSDRGATGARSIRVLTAILTGVLATPTGEVVASGINTIIYSEDGGAFLELAAIKTGEQTPGMKPWPRARTAVGKRRVMSVGAGGTILQLTQ